jgi:hypothetical protein
MPSSLKRVPCAVSSNVATLLLPPFFRVVHGDVHGIQSIHRASLSIPSQFFGIPFPSYLLLESRDHPQIYVASIVKMASCGKAPLPEPQPTTAQTETFLPKVLAEPESEAHITKMDDLTDGKGSPLPKYDLLPDEQKGAALEERKEAILSLFARRSVAYQNGTLEFFWRRIWQLIESTPAAEIAKSETLDLYQCLLRFSEEVPEYKPLIFLNEKHGWLPFSPDLSGRPPVTIFVPDTTATKSEPERLHVDGGAPHFIKSKPLFEASTETDATKDADDVDRVGVFHGASGSGKTSAMLEVAVAKLNAEVVIHFRGALLELGIQKNLAALHSTDTKVRNGAVQNALVKVVQEIAPIRSFLKRKKSEAPEHGKFTVVIVLDEMGATHNLKTILRGICAARGSITSQLATMLRVDRVVLLCGGTGVDTVEGHGGKPSPSTASNQDDFYVVNDFGAEATDWTNWLAAQGPGGRLVSSWLKRNNTHLCRLANDLLTNCRSAKILTFKLLTAANDLVGDCEPVHEPLTIENVMPNTIFQCILSSIGRFKKLNGLCDVKFVRAAELIRDAVALQMCAVKDDLKADKTDLLLTKYGILTDTWVGLDEKTALSRKESLGVPRYRVSRALVAMGRLGVGGRLTSLPDANRWSSWEDDTCRFFATLARSAMVMKKEHMFPDSEVFLLLDTNHQHPPCGFEYVDGARVTAVQEKNPQVQSIRMIGTAWRFQDRAPRGFVSGSLRTPLQPAMKDIDFDKVVREIKASLTHCDFRVIRNAPKANYADAICVNKLNQELWLIQCKFSEVSEGAMTVKWNDELNKMGYEEEASARPSSYVKFTRKLLAQIGAEFQPRYFLCLAHPPGRNPPAIPEGYLCHNVHVLEHPKFDFGVIAPDFDNDLASWQDDDLWEPEASRTEVGERRKRFREGDDNE